MPPRATVHLPPMGWAGATIVVGIALGLVTALLLARDLRVAESWGTILGTSLLATGLAASGTARLGNVGTFTRQREYDDEWLYTVAQFAFRRALQPADDS